MHVIPDLPPEADPPLAEIGDPVSPLWILQLDQRMTMF